MELSGKVCLVTGASRGIGRATALVLVARGAVVAAAASDASRLEGLEGVASRHGADLADPANALGLAEAVLAEHGRVDVLVNDAAVRDDALVAQATLDDVDRAFQVNALSPFLLAGALVEQMAERGEGVVVNLVAPVVAPGRRGMGAYAASKAALASLTQTLRMEAGGAASPCSASTRAGSAPTSPRTARRSRDPWPSASWPTSRRRPARPARR